MVYVVITSYKEASTIGTAVEQVICPNTDLWPNLKLLVVAPDDPTLKEAERVCQRYEFSNVILIKDSGAGKPRALNIAVDAITNGMSGTQHDDVLVLTDGDVRVDDAAIKNLLKTLSLSIRYGATGAHPVSADSRTSLFGYFSHVFCSAAHVRRTQSSTVPMSGYLYAVRTSLIKNIFPVPEQIRAEDAYVSQKILALGSKISYTPDALVYVKFPKNLADWYRQKTRSLGGNVQLADRSFGPCAHTPRSVFQDLEMVFFPLTFARSLKEFVWSLLLYPLRLSLWLSIYYNHLFKKYKSGAWDRIESSK